MGAQLRKIKADTDFFFLYELLTNYEGNSRVPEAAAKAICSCSGTRRASDEAHIHPDPLGTQGHLPAQPGALPRRQGTRGHGGPAVTARAVLENTVLFMEMGKDRTAARSLLHPPPSAHRRGGKGVPRNSDVGQLGTDPDLPPAPAAPRAAPPPPVSLGSVGRFRSLSQPKWVLKEMQIF